MPKRSKDNCYQDLKRRILITDLAPGSDLDEVSLSEHYGMSRTPLREVLQRLAGAGYADIQSNRGAKVASMDVTAMRVFFQTAPMVYANMARLAAENRTQGQLDNLKDTQQAFLQAIATGDPSDAALKNHDFHDQIGQMAHNAYLMAALNRLLIDHARLGQTFYRPTEAAETALIETAAAQHDAMIDAFERQDPDVAVDLTLQHWTLSRDRMERFVRPDPLPVDLTLSKDTADAI